MSGCLALRPPPAGSSPRARRVSGRRRTPAGRARPGACGSPGPERTPRGCTRSVRRGSPAPGMAASHCQRHRVRRDGRGQTSPGLRGHGCPTAGHTDERLKFCSPGRNLGVTLTQARGVAVVGWLAAVILNWTGRGDSGQRPDRGRRDARGHIPARPGRTLPTRGKQEEPPGVVTIEGVHRPLTQQETTDAPGLPMRTRQDTGVRVT